MCIIEALALVTGLWWCLPLCVLWRIERNASKKLAMWLVCGYPRDSHRSTSMHTHTHTKVYMHIHMWLCEDVLCVVNTLAFFFKKFSQTCKHQPCLFCPQTRGPMKRVVVDASVVGWAHILCAEWLPPTEMSDDRSHILIRDHAELELRKKLVRKSRLEIHTPFLFF